MAKILKQASRNNLNVAIIMDGNGRWALSNSLNISKGHQKGVQVVKDIVQESVQQKISSLTLYALAQKTGHAQKQR
jgi:undecaprenyl diphosphate synthase